MTEDLVWGLGFRVLQADLSMFYIPSLSLFYTPSHFQHECMWVEMEGAPQIGDPI